MEREHGKVTDMEREHGKVINVPGIGALSLQEWTYNPLRSAFIVTPYGQDMEWQLFAHGRSQEVAGDPTVRASMAHTNLPRSGESGLPKGWEALLYRWRATMSEPLAQPVLDFANECSVELHYNRVNYASVTLAELALDTMPIAGDRMTGEMPIHMKENLSFGVRVTCGSRTALEALQKQLRGTPTIDPTIAAELAQLERLAPEAVSQELRRIQTKLMPGRKLTCWVSLQGLLKRVVI